MDHESPSVTTTPLGTRLRLEQPYAQAVARVRAALAEQGFGVLTEIDVRATLWAKLGAEMEDYVILGACRPQLAHRALEIDRSVGLLLPCTVVVRADGDASIVEMLAPEVMVDLSAQRDLAPVAAEAAERLAAVRRALAAPDG